MTGLGCPPPRVILVLPESPSSQTVHLHNSEGSLDNSEPGWVQSDKETHTLPAR